MATQQSTADFIVDQLSEAGTVLARKMFGEFGLYCDGRLVGLICDDQLFVKPTPASQSILGEGYAMAAPYPGAKPQFQISAALLEDASALSRLIRATADDLPAPAPKKPPRSKAAK